MGGTRSRLVAASFVVAGVLAIGRQFVEAFDPVYFAPSNALDYSAVILMSAAFAATSVALWLLRSELAAHRMSVVLVVPSISAMVFAVGNLLEDGFGMKEVGDAVFAVGGLGLFVGLMLAGLVSLLLFDRDRWVAIPLLIGTSYAFGDLVGVMGVGWLLMSWVLIRRHTVS